METFISPTKRKRPFPNHDPLEGAAEESTDLKLAILASIHLQVPQDALLDALIDADGSVQRASSKLKEHLQGKHLGIRPLTKSTGYQSSLFAFRKIGLFPDDDKDKSSEGKAQQIPQGRTKKGHTLHLYTPEDIAAHTPCSIIHQFLPAKEAENLLLELLAEAPTFERQIIKLFDHVVQSPHSACFYVDNFEEIHKQRTQYLYGGSYLTDVREITPHMRAVSAKVEEAVNLEIKTRISTCYPAGEKLKYQSPSSWKPNAAFVNCYSGGSESVGYHSDQLTYLGPRAVIGSLSLGVTREFRVRKIMARDENEDSEGDLQKIKNKRADAEGQIAIHLPHNSLLVMHADMQEEWKHSIHPAQAIDPHPVSGNKRINITYRNYRECFHPRYTPRCKCDVATVLRCVQRKRENRGRYMWMCHAGNTPGKQGCTFFQWAEFDDNGNPPWMNDLKAA